MSIKQSNPWSVAYLLALLGFEITIISRLAAFVVLGASWLIVLRALTLRNIEQ